MALSNWPRYINLLAQPSRASAPYFLSSCSSTRLNSELYGYSKVNNSHFIVNQNMPKLFNSHVTSMCNIFSIGSTVTIGREAAKELGVVFTSYISTKQPTDKVKYTFTSMKIYLKCLIGAKYMIVRLQRLTFCISFSVCVYLFIIQLRRI